MYIIVNGETHFIDQETLSYEDIVLMAGRKPDRILTVVYSTRRKGDEQRQGTLTPGGSTLIEDGMVFSVADTSSA